MRLRLVVGVVVFFIIAAVGLAGSMFGSVLSASRTSIAYSQTPVTSGNPIVLENAHLGTSAWKTPRGKEASTHRLVDCKSCHVDPEIGVLALDPLYGLDKTRLTAQRRDPILVRPENALIGVMFSDLTHLPTITTIVSNHLEVALSAVVDSSSSKQRITTRT